MSTCAFYDKVTVQSVMDTYNKLMYPFFTNGQYNLNVFAIRSLDTVSNRFDDLVCLLYKNEKNIWVLKKYDATTDPGKYYRENPMNVNGTAIIIPGFYKSVYQIGLHNNKYEALRQYRPMRYWRDRNRDNKLDMCGHVYEEIAYTNIHRATNVKGSTSIQVDKWSAGCNVIASYDDFAEFMYICHRAANKYGNSFSYTLFTEDQMCF